MINEPLVAVTSTDRVLVEPIWEKPVDEIEGPLYQQYIQKNPTYTSVLVRSTLAEMIYKAADNLPSSLRLIIRAGHRPLEVQEKLLEMVKLDFIKQNPNASVEEALHFARTYVSDPAIKLPPHCCGAAIDVDVLDTVTGDLVDFGCPVNTDSPIAGLDTDLTTQQQQDNRAVLLAAMTKVGFAPYQHEWWHFSYGDQTWADHYKKSGPIYSLIDV